MDGQKSTVSEVVAPRTCAGQGNGTIASRGTSARGRKQSACRQESGDGSDCSYDVNRAKIACWEQMRWQRGGGADTATPH